MNERYPLIRISRGPPILSDGLFFCFFMRRSHAEIAPAVLQALDTYCQVIKPWGLQWYPDQYGQWQPLDEAAWAQIRREILDTSPDCTVELTQSPSRYDVAHFEYRGRQLDAPHYIDDPNTTSVIAFWLPTEYLEERGPEHVRGLALELAAPLPFCTGYVSMAFNCTDGSRLYAKRHVRDLCLRYPGMDIHDPSLTSRRIGTRARGAYWLNFYGQPLLGQLRGPSGLRQQLPSPDISIQELSGERVLLTLGEWPEVGDTEAGKDLPLYRALTRVLQPHLHLDPHDWVHFTEEELNRYHRRLLDPVSPTQRK